MNKGFHQTHAIETIDLSHRFANGETALDEINLRVERGSIYGFLGPNGAGKTTTLKLILGLLKKQRGEILVGGRPFDAHRVEILKRVGSMIESPSLYAHLTARENLAIWQKIHRCPPARIDETLALVGLAGTGRKRAGEFSLGMKQRLGLAVALLNEPEILILDEPTNGLDPNGILEMRGLLGRLNRERGITIVVSSHLLPEVEKIATHVGVINRGRLLFQGTLAALMERRQAQSRVVFETSDAARAAALAGEAGLDASVDAANLTVPLIERERVAALNRRLVENGVAVYRIGRVESDLEKIFFDLISE